MEYSRGAEAIIEKSKDTVKKIRKEKKYRSKVLDSLLRKERTSREAKLIQKVSMLGINVPKVMKISEYSFSMKFINGKRPMLSKVLAHKMGEILAKLHNANIIHGDFTIANIIESKNEIYVIDFGLGFVSKRIEDKADDVFASLKSMKGFESNFIEGYLNCNDSGKILDRVDQIKHRARYME